ncbi:MAG TPA: phage holin family protein [Candidatus Limnocylindria bacterium]|nr:phage holin family protein [Candidatus Limnocylindria bacterium]
MTQSPEPRQSMFGLVGRLVNGVMELARLEATRGRQELGQMVDDTKQGMLLLGIAGGLLFMALMVLLILLVEAITLLTGLPRWVTALISLVVLIGVGAGLGYIGAKRIRVGAPEETIEAVKEDIEWARRLLKRG